MNLNKQLQTTINELGYEKLTPVQEAAIPILLSGADLMAQAQTGTGKTAAFALPILQLIKPEIKATQALILAPTRELAIQVAEAFNRYGRNLNIGATSIYGGQSYTLQKQALKKKPLVIVATPGRLVDMLKQKHINLTKVKHLILDEADEMLKMGFLDDVEWIIEQTPESRQIGLFSATLQKKITNITKSYMRNPEVITIKPKLSESTQITQKMIMLANRDKLDVLTRILAADHKSGKIIFVRTKQESMELAEKLQARGHTAAPINGDMNQAARERAIDRLKQGRLNILVATDVAARGIDVDRVEHVINYDMPFDVDSYVHRIGRTGRGGREGLATLFVTPRERGLLRDIEKRFGNLEEINPPSHTELNQKKFNDLSEKVVNIANKSKKLKDFLDWSEQLIAQDESCSTEEKLAALAYLVLQDELFEEVKAKPVPKKKSYAGKKKTFSKNKGYSGARKKY